MTIKQLNQNKDLFSIRELCRRAGLDYTRINNKIKRCNELTVVESHLLSLELKKVLTNLLDYPEIRSE